MSLERQKVWSKALTSLGRAWRAVKAVAWDEAGVTAIEYGLVAALIVLVASASIGVLGGGVSGMWTLISTAVVNAL